MKVSCILLYLSFSLVFILFSFSAFAQVNYTLNWCFEEKQWINFSSGVPVSKGLSAVTVEGSNGGGEGNATISDRNTGELLFYLTANVIYDKSHKPMQNGTGLFGERTSSQACIIVPVPKDSLKYYIFTTGAFPSGIYGLAYSVVDIALNNGLGAVTKKNIKLNDVSIERIAATKHCNGTDYWVLVTNRLDNSFLAYQATPAGIQPAVISHAGQDDQIETGQLKISPNGKFISKGYGIITSGSTAAKLYKFDNKTGIVSNSISIFYPGTERTYGTEFSSSSNFVYYGLAHTTGAFILQYDLSVFDSAKINNSAFNIGSHRIGIFALQLASDDKIYSVNGVL